MTAPVRTSEDLLLDEIIRMREVTAKLIPACEAALRYSPPGSMYWQQGLREAIAAFKAEPAS